MDTLRWTGGHVEVDRWTGGQVDRWTGGQVDRWTGGQVDRWTGGQVDRWIGGQVQVDRWRWTGGGFYHGSYTRMQKTTCIAHSSR